MKLHARVVAISVSLVGGTLLLIAVWSPARAGSDGTDPQAVRTAADDRGNRHPLVGEWAYKAFFNDPEKGSVAGFGEGTLTIEQVDAGGILNGRLMILDGDPERKYFAPLSVTGRVATSHPISLRFRGRGVGRRQNGASNEDWLYDYQGYRLTDDLKINAPMDRKLGPEDERKLGRGPVMAGQVLRVKDHPGDAGRTEPAGQVGTWIAVKKDF
jgi:hypothetical protein